MNVEHTPGPWGFGDSYEGERLILGDGGHGDYVAHVQIHQTPRAWGLGDEREREANARLILAAPDLLAVVMEYANGDYSNLSDDELQNELSVGNEQVRNLIAARAAIAKAVGA